MADKNNTILVTGGLGHIGSMLIREVDPTIVKKIIILDNLSSERYASLFHLPEILEYEFIQADIREAEFAPILERVSAVIHLAALTNAEASHEQGSEVRSVNFEGTKRLADACLAAKVKMFFPSTTSVYGSQASRVDETSGELKPQSPYASSKLEAENYLRFLQDKGFRFVVCRFGTIFGPSVGMRFHTAVNKFIWQAVTGQPLTVWQTAWEQKRPYLDVVDCVSAINFILKKDLFNGEVYNVLTENFTIEEIVGVIKEFIPGLKVGLVESPIMNQLSYEVENSKFKKLGFVVSGNLRQGIEATLNLLEGLRHGK